MMYRRYTNVLPGCPHHIDAMYQLASIELLRQKYEPALRRLHHVRKLPLIQSNPLAHALVMASMGESLVGLGNIDASIVILESATSVIRYIDRSCDMIHTSSHLGLFSIGYTVVEIDAYSVKGMQHA
jgi:hypothetical protein